MEEKIKYVLPFLDTWLAKALLKIRQVLQGAWRRIGHNGHLNEVVGGGMPRGHKTLGWQRRLQQRKPLGLIVRAQARGKQDRHGELAALSKAVKAHASV